MLYYYINIGLKEELTKLYKLLKPDLMVNSLHDISLSDLAMKGIEGLIIDLDNTMVEWDCDALSPEIFEWFRSLSSYGLKACIVSNNKKERVSVLAGCLGSPFISRASKPRRRSFRWALQLLDCDRNKTAVIGDQIFTDILGGNRLKMYTILVQPLSRNEFIGTRLVRLVEKLVLRRFKKND